MLTAAAPQLATWLRFRRFTDLHRRGAPGRDARIAEQRRQTFSLVSGL
jgi:hypothetical protein